MSGERQQSAILQTSSGRGSVAEVLIAFRWPTLLLVVVICSVWLTRGACESMERQAEAPLRAVGRIEELATTFAAGFRSGTINSTFQAALPELAPGGSLLEVARFEATETFRREDERRVLFEAIDLGTTVTEIRVPATYRYHLRLDDPWQIDVNDHLCLVKAPALRPSLPPAIHTDRLERSSREGWLRFDGEEQMTALERTITPTLNERASSPETIELVRDRARREVGEFVRAWLLGEDHWSEERFRAIVVTFADEEERPTEPTVELEVRTPD